MRILFAGTPGFAVPALAKIHEESRHDIAAVLTNPDAGSGRGRKLRVSPVKSYAAEQGIPVIQPLSLRSEARREAAAFAADLMVVVAYGKIFGPRFLELFPKGAVNLHPSLLPKYRGPAPIPAAILAGDEISGISVQEVGLEMDAGDIILQEEFAIDDNSDAESLSEYCAQRGAQMMVEALDLIESGWETRTPQDDSRASYCSLLAKEDGQIDWKNRSEEIHRLIRAYRPWPLAHSSWEGQNLTIRASSPVKSASLSDDMRARASKAEPGTVIGVDKSSGILVKTGDGVLALTRLQQQSKRDMDWKSFINGNPRFISSVLGVQEK